MSDWLEQVTQASLRVLIRLDSELLYDEISRLSPWLELGFRYRLRSLTGSSPFSKEAGVEEEVRSQGVRSLSAAHNVAM